MNYEPVVALTLSISRIREALLLCKGRFKLKYIRNGTVIDKARSE
jgi:hypothetical protein